MLPDVALEGQDSDLAAHLAASRPSPAPVRQPGLYLRRLLAAHGLAETSAQLGHDGGVAEELGELDDGPGDLRRVLTLEDAGADEDRLRTQLHHQGGVGRSGDAAGTEQRDGQGA